MGHADIAFSPDPYLSSTLSYITVRGMQESGLITCAKHYILYEQEPVCTGPLDSEGGRTDCVDVSSDVDGECGALPPSPDLRQDSEGAVPA